MIRLQVINDLAPEVQQILDQVGVQADPTAPMQVAWLPDLTELRALRRSLQRERLIVFGASANIAEKALDNGAIDAFCPPYQADVVADRLRALTRLELAWQRRFKAHERRARRASAELASTQDLLGRLIDATPNPVIAADLRGRVLVFNRAAETALGYDSAWAREQMHIADLYNVPADARNLLADIRNSPTGMIHDRQVNLRCRSGQKLPVLLSAAEVYARDSMPMATVGVFQDRRAELSLQARLEETTRQLIASEKRASAIEVAGTVAHELNQPLTAVMGMIELLSLRPDLDERTQARMTKAYQQLERMAGIVRSIGQRTHSRRSSDHALDTKQYVGTSRILRGDSSHPSGDSLNSGQPVSSPQEVPMFPNAMVMLSLNERDDTLLDAIPSLVQPLGIRRLLLCHVHPVSPFPEGLKAAPATPARPQALDAACKRVRTALPELEVVGLHAVGTPATEVHRIVEAESVDLITLGRAHAEGAHSAWGSHGLKILRESACSALILPVGCKVDLDRVVVGMDFSTDAIAGLQLAASVSPHVEAVFHYDLRAVGTGAMTDAEFHQEFAKNVTDHYEDLIAPALKHPKRVRLLVREGDKVHSALLTQAREAPIVLGSRGLSPVAASLLGSVSESVAGRANSPVFIWRKKGEQLGLLKALVHR